MSGSAKIMGSISVGDIFGDTRITTKPKGFNYIDAIADAAGISYSHAANKLRWACSRGEVERVEVLAASGKVRAAYNVTI